jgi:non-specific serine/threonine protein kinase
VIGPAADLFGLAQTLRYAITGSAPIGHESLRASIHRLLGAGAVSNYSDALLDALSSATATAPAERPQSLDEFRQRLRRLEAQSAALVAPTQLAAAASSPVPLAAPMHPAAVTTHEAAPAPATPQPPEPAAAADDEAADETIDVSSVLGDLLQEPTNPPREAEHRPPEQAHAAPAPDPRVEPTLNFAFNTPVPPIHEPGAHTAPAPHVSHAPQTPHEPQVQVEPPRSHAAHGATGLNPPIGDAPDRTFTHHPSMYDERDTAQFGESFRPKRSLLASPVLRMSALIVSIAALAIVVILAVSGVWDPRGPQLDLPPKATTPGGAALPSPAPPLADTPASAEPAPSPAAAPQAPAPSPAPELAPEPSAAAPAATASAAAAVAPAPRESSTTRRRGAPAAAEAAPTDPRQACAGRTQFALYRCMQAQCAQPRWSAHPECARLRKSDRVEPP